MMSNTVHEASITRIPWWIPTILAAMAGGMAWGIRGQYGHETGAMIAGLLVSLVVIFLLAPQLSNLSAARAVAWCTVAMGIGGTETYGQTVGLTHDAPLVGNWAALRWGMFGLAVKGGVWIGFAGLFLGMGLGGARYRTREIGCLLLAMLGASFIGIRVLNEPFDPDNKILPWIYFSDDWYWEPEGGFVPRRETWGGLVFAYALALAYTGWVKKDRLAKSLGLWGLLGGALGFPGGQSVQAYFVWNREIFNDGFLKFITTGMNPWNIMEISYGTIMGGILGLGSWFNRANMKPVDAVEEDHIPLALEWLLLAIHIPLMIWVDFGKVTWIDFLYDFGPVFACIPLLVITSGKWWPYLQIFTVTLIPIAGKTFRALDLNSGPPARAEGFLLYVIIPLALGFAFAYWIATRKGEEKDGLTFVRRALIFNAWLYYLLNHAFLGYPIPWPWQLPFSWFEVSGRSQSALIFTVCVVCLTLGSLLLRRDKLRAPKPTQVSDLIRPCVWPTG